jgi:hypothetical protein
MSKSFLVLFLKKELLAFTLRESGSMQIGISSLQPWVESRPQHQCRSINQAAPLLASGRSTAGAL